MEEIEVHSKSYLVRWINVKPEHTISWSIQPHKKSLNLGIFKHPGHVGTVTPNPGASIGTDELSIEDPSDQAPQSSAASAKNASAASGSSTVVTEKLKSIGLKPIQWVGKCEADKISQGTYDVPANEGGNYALVVDNTFSKQISKTATFVLVTYSTHAPPQFGHQVHHSQAAANAGGNAGSRALPGTKITGAGESTESLRKGWGRTASGGTTRAAPKSSDSSKSFPTTVHTGVLQKRRRKRHQGYARRFFSLDFTTSTLSYYHDRNSPALRGAVPLSLAAIAANAQTREISIDSGAEIWHLRANNANDFDAWKAALEKASSSTKEANGKPADERLKVRTSQLLKPAHNSVDLRDWTAIEGLVNKVSSSRDTIRSLAKDTDPKYLSAGASSDRRGSPASQISPRSTPEETNGEDYLDPGPRKSFWKRKTSNASANNATNLMRRNINAQLAVPAPGIEAASTMAEAKKSPAPSVQDIDHSVHDQLMVVLRDLESVVAEFSTLISDSKKQREPAPLSAISRVSMESEASQEFFDAPDGGAASPLLTIQHDSEDESAPNEEEEEAVDDASLSGSDFDENEKFSRNGYKLENSSSLFPSKPKSLAPLPLDVVPRRTNIPAPKVLPPSLIGFLRKNVGKDLSSISMPVSANEPTSLLQRAAEQFEYSTLLDRAAAATDGVERLIYVTAFAISPLSNGRVKERAIRKPFNPMLGETFELVREDRGFRFIAEKVSHRPVQLAYQAEAKEWSFAQSPMPTQKFWGKSAEITTEGKARLTLHSSGERYSWTHATCFLRNIIAGEKYVEPVGEMSVFNETTGFKAIATFKAGGVFSGRSEEVSVRAFDTHGQELPLGLQGTWTTALHLSANGNVSKQTIWTAGPLVDNAPKHYGLTSFAAALNEITPVEEGKLPQTDSRLRPDQRALEKGDLDGAEDLKAALETKQRERRKETEENGEVYKPRWFTKVEGDENAWRLKSGKEGYWEERAKGDFMGTIPIFRV